MNCYVDARDMIITKRCCQYEVHAVCKLYGFWKQFEMILQTLKW